LEDEIFNEAMTLIYQQLVDGINNNPLETCSQKLNVGFISPEGLEIMDKLSYGEKQIVVVGKETTIDEDLALKREIMVMEGIGFGLSELGVPVMVTVCTEAWLSPAHGRKIPAGFKPSEDPDRQEVIIVVGATPSGKTNMAVLHIDRLHDNSIIVTDTHFTPYTGEKPSVAGGGWLEKFFEGYNGTRRANLNFSNATQGELEELKKRIMKNEPNSSPPEEIYAEDNPQNSEKLESIDDIFD
jgi:hypothetical protein